MRLALASILLCSLGLAACGGDDDAEPTPAAKPASTAETATTTESKALPGDATKPGTTLELGQQAQVLMTPLSASVDDKTRYPLDVSVTDIKKVSISDLKGVNLDAEQKKATPYFVKILIGNPGKAIPRDEDPGVRIKAVDDRGQEHNSVIFIGDFKQCNDVDPPKPFSGERYETCHVYLIPGGGTLEGVAWTSGIEYVDKPITWR